MAERSQFPGWLRGGLTLLGVAAVGGGAWLYWQFRPRSLDLLDAAAAIPATAVVATELTTELAAWETLERFASPTAREWLQQRLAGDRLPDLAAAGLDYQEDIEPLLGAALVANIPNEPGGVQPLFVIGIEEPLQTLKLSAALQGEGDGTRPIAPYNGTPIVEIDARGGDRTYGTLVGNFLLLSPNLAVLHQAIDTIAGKIDSYADRPEARELLQEAATLELPTVLARVYVADYPDLMAASTDSVPIVGGLSGRSVAQWSGVESAILGVGASDEGLQIQALVRVPESSATAPLSDAASAEFPAATFGLIQGRAFGESWQTWQERTAGGESPPFLPEFDSQGSGLGAPGDNPLAQLLPVLPQLPNLLGWFDGEFALGAIATPSNPAGWGWAFWVETSQPETGRDALRQLDRLVRFIPTLDVERRTVGGTEVTQWRQQNREDVFLARSWLAEDRLLVTGGVPIAEVVTAPKALLSVESYRRLDRAVPTESTGRVYLDFERLRALPEFAEIELATTPEGSPWPNVRGLRANLQQRDRTTVQIDIAIALKRYD